MLDKLRQLLTPEVDPAIKLMAVSTLLGREVERQSNRILDLEARQLQKGDQGERGPKGDKGDKGDRGSDGAHGAVGPMGPSGLDGKEGRQGKQGKPGVSVVDVNIDIDNHLTVTLSDGKVIDAGEMPSAEDVVRTFVSGNAWQITVSDAPPSNPQLNQLWLDIS